MSSANNDFICLDDFEKYALKHLNKMTADYYKSGANLEQSLKENRLAFNRLRLKPRFLRDVTNRNLTVQILGRQVSFPVGIAPSAMQRMAHPDGEIATIKGASSEGVIMILSTLSTTSLEDVAQAAPESIRWFQLYIYKDRQATEKLVKRAAAAGYSALVLTVDAPVFGRRLNDSRNIFTLPSHLRCANFDAVDSKSELGQTSNDESNLNRYVSDLFDSNVTWKDIEWLKSISSMPVILKGILTAEDAILAVENGISGIIVSNHGARQLDGVPATIEILPEIARAVAGRCEVYLDGGVRTGTDVIKALALGAAAVFIGRPIVWGLVCGGEQGVKKVLQVMKKEYDTALALLGCRRKDDIKPSMVVRQEVFSRL